MSRLVPIRREVVRVKGEPGPDVIPTDEFIGDKIAEDGSAAADAFDARLSNDLAAVRDGYDVILLAGQSEVVGFNTGLDVTYLDNPDPRIKQWAGSGAHLGTAVAAVDPLLHHAPVLGAVGPGMSFAKWWVERTGRKVLLVPVGHSSTGFTTTSVSPAPAGYHTVVGGGSWDKDATDGGFNLYDFAVDQANAAIASDDGNRLVAVLWSQGSADGETVSGDVTEGEYADFVDALIDNFRADIDGGDDVPVLIGRQSRDWYLAHPVDQWTDDVHLDTPVRKTRTAWTEVPPVGMLHVDNIHMNAVAQRLTGGAYYPEAYELALANVLDGNPIAPTEITATQSGTTLTIRWARPECRVTNYRVQTNTGSGWTTVARTASTLNEQVSAGHVLGTTVDVRVATINEEGTSVYSAPVTITVKDVPPVPTGLAVTPTAWSGVVSWNAAADATGYVLQYKKTADAGWTDLASADTSEVVPRLVSSTSYDFRVKASNEAGNSAASATVTVSTLAPTYIAADAGLDPKLAFSVRKIRAAYAGQCLRVRRSSDNTQQDIGFDGNGLLNVAALLAFVGAGNGFVVTWYNQGSFVGGNATNATAAAQPQIVAAGVLLTHNTLPALSFDGVDDFLSAPATTVLPSANGGTALAAAQTRGANRSLFTESAVGGNPRWTPGHMGVSLQEYFIIGNDLGTIVSTAATNAAIADDDTLNQETFIDTKTDVTIRRNGAATSVNATPYTRSGAFNPTFTNIGTSITPFWHQGKVSELVLWDNQLPDLAAAEANQRGYYGTP